MIKCMCVSWQGDPRSMEEQELLEQQKRVRQQGYVVVVVVVVCFGWRSASTAHPGSAGQQGCSGLPGPRPAVVVVVSICETAFYAAVVIFHS